MKNLIFGLPGQDSWFLAKILIERGEEVIGCYRSEGDALNDFLNIGLTRIEKCNMHDWFLVRELINRHKPDRIYNLAAYSSVGGSFDRPIKCMENNVSSHINLLESMKEVKRDAELYYAGSSEELTLTSPYGVSKDTVRRYNDLYRSVYGLKIVHTQNFNHSSWRTTNNFLFGKVVQFCADLKHKITNSRTFNNNINDWIPIPNNRSVMLSVGNLQSYKDISYAQDVMQAGVILMDHKIYGTTKVASGILTKMEDVVAYAFQSIGITDYQKWLYSTSDLIRPIESTQQVEECLFLRSLGWRPTLNIEQLTAVSIEEYTKRKLDAVC